MNASELGIVSEYTVEGELLGHIIQGIKMIDQTAVEVGADPEVSLLLQHMVLSHHYEPEFGSPKRPMIPEAEILHYLDIMDARMYDMGRALEKIEDGHFSDKVWLLNNRKLYKSSVKNSRDDKEPNTLF
jgi:3'-5' exoribonuclease